MLLKIADKVLLKIADKVLLKRADKVLLKIADKVLLKIANPLSPDSDKHISSPYDVTTWFNIHVMRIKEMITEDKMWWSNSLI